MQKNREQQEQKWISGIKLFGSKKDADQLVRSINCEHILLYERQSPEGTMQRFFCKEKPDNAVLVKPNLEDVFLVVYRDER